MLITQMYEYAPLQNDLYLTPLQFSGGIIAGLSLISPSVMTLRSVKHKEKYAVDALLPPLSLYIMRYEQNVAPFYIRAQPVFVRRVARYDFGHEIPADQSVWNGEKIPRERRISIMFRDEKGNAEFG